METNTAELELAPPVEGEAPMKQLAPYDEYRTKIEALKKTAETITVTDISDKAGMQLARTTRLALKDIRVEIIHRHKELKESILVEGRKIDKGKNDMLAVLEPLESRLQDQEDFIKNETARIQGEKRTARAAEIAPFLSGPLAVDLGTIDDAQYAGMLSDAKDAHAARVERERKAKEEAAAKAKAEAEERERVRLENERLKKEAEEREAAAKKEREEAAARQAEIEKKLEAERKAAAAEAARIKAEAEAAAEKERQRVAAEQAAAEAQAKKERDAIEAKARAEREAAERKAAAELAETQRKAKEAQAIADAVAKKEREAREKIEAELAAKKAAEEKAESDRLAAIEAAELAPEKEKLMAFAKTVRELAVPNLTTDKGMAAMKEVAAKVEGFAGWIEKQAKGL